MKQICFYFFYLLSSIICLYINVTIDKYKAFDKVWSQFDQKNDQYLNICQFYQYSNILIDIKNLSVFKYKSFLSVFEMFLIIFRL